MSGAESYHEEEALGKAYDSRLMKRLLAYLRPYRWWVILAVVCLVTATASQLYLTVMLQQGIDNYIIPGDRDGLAGHALLFLGVMAVLFIFRYAETMVTMFLGQSVQHDIRRQIFNHLQKLHLGYFDKNPVGRLLTRVTSDVNVLNEMFSSGVVTIIGDILLLLLIVGLMLFYNAELALWSFVALPVLFLGTMYFRSKVRDVYRNVRLKLARLNAFMQEHITGMRIVQLFTREKRTFSSFDGINADLRNQHFKSIYYYATFFPFVEIIGSLAVVLIMYKGGVRIQEDVLTWGELAAFIRLVQQFYRPIMDLTDKYNILQNSMASSERIFALLDTEPQITSPVKAPVLERVDGRIAFENVWFAYKDDDYVLRDISFTVEPGETVAVVGATGAGKTSLISLLYRFYDYQKGTIRLDGHPLPEIDLTNLRSHLGLVLQDVFLFTGTIADNVRLREQSISDDAVREALGRVGYDRFLNGNGDGLATEIRERGTTLSTGQKQLLSFARALAFDPAVLILDEATSSVDTETEKLIQTALQTLLAGRTSIIIAHRLSTIEQADKIIVLHRGQLREIGRHEELLAHGGLYHKLYQLQYKKAVSEAALSAPANR